VSASHSHSWAARYRARLILCDTLAVVVTAIGALLLARAVTGATPIAAATALVLPGALAAAVWLAALALFRTRDEHVFGVGADEYKRVMSASTIAVGAIAVGVSSLDLTTPRPYLLIAWSLGVLLLLAERWGWRRWLNHERCEGRALPGAIVVGDADEVIETITRTQHGPVIYSVIGAAMDAPEDQRHVRAVGRSFPVVSTPAGVVAAAARTGAEAIIVAGGASGNPAFVQRLSWELEGTSIELVLATRLTEVAGPRIHFQAIDDLPLMHVDIPRFEGGKHIAKRALDIVGSALGLVLLSPLLLAITVAVHLDSPGDAVFRQKRVGRGGRTFVLLKFRSMTADAEQKRDALLDRDEGNGVQFKLHDDPRVTRVGRFLRRYSLDELPQLVNVLVGDMSLVGPRPPLPSEVECYEAHVHRRLYLKPGLTGPWQVSGRSDLSWEESVRLDLHYIENWSLIGDLMLLWRTVHVVFHPVGAY
jgi:exopolysaccharide biosynthesis polyprenyl glycosylphosphotransferase